MAKKLFMVLIVVYITLIGNISANAATAIITGKITKTVYAKGLYGGCMAALDVGINNVSGLDCVGSYVTFSCSGVFNEKDIAYHMASTAEMALALGNDAKVYITDSKKHNGYCFAYRVQVHQ